MLYLTTTKSEITFHIGDSIPASLACSAICVQADCDELDYILRHIPSLDTSLHGKFRRVQKFYGVDAVKAALTFSHL